MHQKILFGLIYNFFMAEVHPNSFIMNRYEVLPM